MTTHFLCIDSSLSCTGLAIMRVVSTDPPVFHLVSKNSIKVKQDKAKTRFERKADIIEIFEYYLNQFAHIIHFALFEEYAYAAPGQLCDLAELAGLYKYVLHKRNIPFDTIAPKSVKKYVTGTGNASKELVAESIHKFIENVEDFIFKNNDETDAIAIGIAYSLHMFEIEKQNELKQNTKED